MLGFDWVTYRGETVAVDADMLVTGAIAVNAPLNENRDRFDLIEGLSGTNFNDLLRGDDRVEADLSERRAHRRGQRPCAHAAGIARITGLAAHAACRARPSSRAATSSSAARAATSSKAAAATTSSTATAGSTCSCARRTRRRTVTLLVNSLQAAEDDVFAGRINPGTITSSASIVATGSTGRTSTWRCSAARAPTTRSSSAPGVVTVTDNVGTDGVDTLFNIERLQFTDVTQLAGGVGRHHACRTCVQPDAGAGDATLAAEGFGVVRDARTARPFRRPSSSARRRQRARVATAAAPSGIVVSLGPVQVQVPNVVGSTLAGATTSLHGSGLRGDERPRSPTRLRRARCSPRLRPREASRIRVRPSR